jgi:hypothetical protein
MVIMIRHLHSNSLRQEIGFYTNNIAIDYGNSNSSSNSPGLVWVKRVITESHFILFFISWENVK